jgi:SAM-dependent MidA family methyltransferase
MLSEGSAAAQPVPGWLRQRLRAAHGSVPFATFMDWALHDPLEGAYGSGRLTIGPRGDFATSPSLGPDFAALLLQQVAGWLQQLGPGPLTLIETGPGEGTLALELANGLVEGWPDLARRTALLLVEPNAGMAERQRRLLAHARLPVRWWHPDQPCVPEPSAVVLAHEVLDALPVERIVWDGQAWRQQRVVLQEPPDGPSSLALAAGDRLGPAALARLRHGAEAADDPGLWMGDRPAGWCTELHPALEGWMQRCAALVQHGWLLVIDYALEARRYYAPSRSDGTLMAYRRQTASANPLQEPGHWDLTAHLCLETLERAALGAGWQPRGHCRQGTALLALGLAGRLHGLQAAGAGDLAERLARREALLRLVDPAALGEFRWWAGCRGSACATGGHPLFLCEPPRDPPVESACGQD